MTFQMDTVRTTDNYLEIQWKDDVKPSRYPYFWLRDHCHALHSMNQETNQRQVDTFSLPVDLKAVEAKLSEDGSTVSIRWEKEEQKSIYPASFLREMATTGLAKSDHPSSLWTADEIAGHLPTVSYDDVMAGDEGLKSWVELIDYYGFAIVDNTPATPEATEALARRITYIRETIFGGFWDFTANQAFADSAYSTVEIGPHTDGTYSVDSPGYQMFHCLEFDGTGGESIFVDGFRVAEEIRTRDPKAFDTLTSVPVPAQYLGDGVHLRAEHPIIGLGRDGTLQQIAYNNYDRAPFRLEDDQQDDFYRGLRLFNELINDRCFQLRFGLRPGTVVLFDNWRVMHARDAYQGHRRLCGAYLNKEDFLSKLRVLRKG
ncbi:trimethyllysine dioxygenase [Kiloniella laminariae]|uniref:trimethyllysine dioxygenase n=1 Tax=Kiloniella laminariae TaxID=454162 RepID=A0ABT4LPP9_9PROT|nr:trimethyllysine dioxygenase [Kiloniella laminariae]MCZ4283067.1 trimethyllysine dioxygenase [Kiloniella laminariae]